MPAKTISLQLADVQRLEAVRGGGAQCEIAAVGVTIPDIPLHECAAIAGLSQFIHFGLK